MSNFEFLDEICQKRVLPVKNRTSEHQHWILHIWIRLSTKFQLKLTILIFWTNLTQERYFRSKTEKVNMIFEFCIFELLKVPNFSLNWQFHFLDQICPKSVFLLKNEKKWKSPFNSALYIFMIWIAQVPDFSLNWQFWIFGPNFLKKGISGWI